MAGRPRRILYVTEALHRAGTEGHLANIAPAMRDAGWEVSIFCLSGLGPLAAEMGRKGVAVIGPPVSRTSKRSPLFSLRIGLASVKLFWTMVQARPFIVHFFLPGPYLVGAPLAALARTPVRVMSRRSLNRYQDSWPLARRIEQVLHQQMNAVLANSEAIVRELVDEERCDPERVQVIYNGVDVSRFESAAPLPYSSIGGRDPKLTLITVANLIPYKGHADLFQALSAIGKDLPDSWRLLCVGRDAGIEKSLMAQARRLGIGENVLFLGERADVDSLLKSSDIALLCSHEEGFPNAILEAMAAGLPVIATDVGGSPEAVVDGKTGLIVPPQDPKRLGKAILELANDAAKRTEYGKYGHDRVTAHFGLSACVEQYERLYRSLTERSCHTL